MRRNDRHEKTETISLADPAIEVEVARRRAIHHLHDAGRILSEALPMVSLFNRREHYTDIIGSLNVVEQRLSELAPE